MTRNAEILYLARRTLEGLGLSTASVVAGIEHLIRERARSRAWSAPKSAVYRGEGRLFMSMLAAADDPPFAAVKSLGLNPRNPERGLPAIGALITLLDGDTGLPAAVMDGSWITAVRTAGLSAVAAKRLARPASAVAAFVGCGAQALSHLEAFAETFPLEEVRAFGRGAASRDALCRSAAGLGLKAVASASARQAVEGADLVVTSVPEAPDLVPFLDPSWLKPGAFVSSIDLGRSWPAEGWPLLDRIVIDDLELEAAMARPMLAPELVGGDLAGLVTGSLPARRSDTARIAFVSRGLALADLALAALAYERAREASAGVCLEA